MFLSIIVSPNNVRRVRMLLYLLFALLRNTFHYDENKSQLARANKTKVARLFLYNIGRTTLAIQNDSLSVYHRT